MIRDYELKAAKQAFEQVAKENNKEYSPQLVYIIVKKKINTKFFVPIQGGRNSNPGPGTLVSSEVTDHSTNLGKGEFDFFLISQGVRDEKGVANPTYYHVLLNETLFSPEEIQHLTYKLCFLYYNFSGSVRYPAPVRYAEKVF
jgi:aubergine-like protein